MNQSLRRQVNATRQVIRDRGGVVEKVFAEVCSGQSLDPLDRPQLIKALEHCRATGLPLVAPTFNRLFRASAYHPVYNREARPTREEMEQFKELTVGVQIFTICDPDATNAEQEEFLKRLSRSAENRGGPRGKRKGRGNKLKRKWARKAYRMWQEGKPVRGIADHVCRVDHVYVSHVTVATWISELGKFC